MYSTPIGHPYRTTGGIQWQIIQHTYTATYPFKRHIVEFVAHPTEEGKRSDAYLEKRRAWGDEWVRDLTDSEYLTDHLCQAGLAEAQATEILTTAHQLRMTTPL